MLKKLLPLLTVPLLLAGCATTFTNLTPQQQIRTPNNLYQVEAALDTRQETLRWSSIRASVLVGRETFPMRVTPLLNNRWEGLIPVTPDVSLIRYRYKMDYDYNAFGKPKIGTYLSPEYTLRIKEASAQSN